jgi:hypothetical protein
MNAESVPKSSVPRSTMPPPFAATMDTAAAPKISISGT